MRMAGREPTNVCPIIILALHEESVGRSKRMDDDYTTSWLNTSCRALHALPFSELPFRSTTECE